MEKYVVLAQDRFLSLQKELDEYKNQSSKKQKDNNPNEKEFVPEQPPLSNECKSDESLIVGGSISDIAPPGVPYKLKKKRALYISKKHATNWQTLWRKCNIQGR